MAKIKTACSCGVNLTVLTGEDVRFKSRKDGKQVVYTDSIKPIGWSYDIFRCEGCGEPVHITCKEAVYG